MLYQQLISGREINKNLFCSEYNVSAKSLERDILSIRLFLSESYSGKEVVFDKTRGIYKMTGAKINELTKDELFPIIEILQNCNAFNGSELEGLITALLSASKSGGGSLAKSMKFDKTKISAAKKTNTQDNFRLE